MRPNDDATQLLELLSDTVLLRAPSFACLYNSQGCPLSRVCASPVGSLPCCIVDRAGRTRHPAIYLGCHFSSSEASHDTWLKSPRDRDLRIGSMDATHIFRQGFGAVGPRQNHTFISHPPPLPRKQPLPVARDNNGDNDSSGQRIAHTLTACCRCRQVCITLLLLNTTNSSFTRVLIAIII